MVDDNLFVDIKQEMWDFILGYCDPATLMNFGFASATTYCILIKYYDLDDPCGYSLTDYVLNDDDAIRAALIPFFGAPMTAAYLSKWTTASLRRLMERYEPFIAPLLREWLTARQCEQALHFARNVKFFGQSISREFRVMDTIETLVILRHLLVGDSSGRCHDDDDFALIGEICFHTLVVTTGLLQVVRFFYSNFDIIRDMTCCDTGRQRWRTVDTLRGLAYARPLMQYIDRLQKLAATPESPIVQQCVLVRAENYKKCMIDEFETYMRMMNEA